MPPKATKETKQSPKAAPKLAAKAQKPKAAAKAGKAGAPKKAPQKGGKKAPAKQVGKKGGKKEVVRKAKPMWQQIKAAHIEKTPKNYSIGGTVQHKRDLTRFVKWPRYIQLQRKKRILLQRFKVPPTINQFTRTLDKSSVHLLFKMFNKYRPETRTGRKRRLYETAQLKVKSDADKKAEPVKIKKPISIKFGLNVVTKLIEQKKASLVVIAHDVDPVELVIWLPALCRRKGIPYCIIKGRARLGQVVHRKTTSVCAFTKIKPADKNDFAVLTKVCMDSFNENPNIRKDWGGCKLGSKATARLLKKQQAIKAEEDKKKAATL